MGTNKLCLILVCPSLTACVVSHDMRITAIEILEPGIINIPEHVKTVALINSASNSIGYQSFAHSEHFLYTINTERDTTIKYRVLLIYVWMRWPQN